MAKKNVPGEVRHHGKPLTREGIAALMAEGYGWIANDGDELNGTVLGVKVGTSNIQDEPKPYPIVVVLMDEGKEIPDREDETLKHDVIAIHCFHGSLVNEMISQRPETGDRIWVKRIGERGTPQRRGWNVPVVWAVAVTKPSGEAPDVWAAFGASRPTNEPAMASQGQFEDEPPF